MDNLGPRTVELLENHTPYAQDELLALAQRNNNNKRKFLLLNRKQGKHLAVAPDEVLTLFKQLGQMLLPHYSQRKTAIIGFAETATAIGAAVAAQFSAPVLLLQTSRETLLEDNLVDFKEEHSHAIEQKLYCSRYKDQLLAAEVIIFVEDEVTTGNTIWNFVQALRQAQVVSEQVQFAVASLVNSLTDDLLETFAQRGICYHYLVRGCYHAELDPYPHLQSLKPWRAAELSPVRDPELWQINGKLESRSGIENIAYHQAALMLGAELLTRLTETYGELSGQVLILGTEEFMYPAILAADQLQKRWPDCQVVVHATTRSPIKISQDDTYPITNGCQLASLYEADRQTFVYNLRPYDWAIWLTDAENLQPFGAFELEQALQQAGCKNILGVRWCKE